MTLTVDIPPETEAAKLVRAAVALYDARLLSQGQAAEMAGLSRAEFIAALGKEGVAIFQYDSVEELLAEAGLEAASTHP